MKPNNHITSNECATDQNNCWRKLLFPPLIVFLFLFLIIPFNPCAAEEPALIENSYGENTPAVSKLLVAYATLAGSTAEIADAIGKKLAEGGAMVDVKPVEKVQNIDGYQGVVLGSPIYMGSPLPEMTDFIRTHKEELQKVPTAYFIVSLVQQENTPKNQAKADFYLNPMRKEVTPVDAIAFTGKMDYSKLSFFEKLFIKYIIGMPECDLRDWKQIDDWAEKLLPKLTIIKKDK